MRALGGIALFLSGCGASAPSDPGTNAFLRIDGATFYAEPMPHANGGPSVVTVNVASNQVAPDTRNLPLEGTLAPDATGALVGLVGDEGYWVLPAGAADVNTPGYPTFQSTMGFSADLEPGARSLVVQASDASGRFGAPFSTALTVLPADLPPGTLVIALSWDTESDLDLHVVQPGGIEIFARDINSVPLPKPGKPVDPSAWKQGGILDVDSNADCVIDGRRRENVSWSVPPPSGTYIARVDTFSLCQATAARWEVTAVLNGKVLGNARGSSGPIDAEGPHDRGAGVTALTFQVP